MSTVISYAHAAATGAEGKPESVGDAHQSTGENPKTKTLEVEASVEKAGSSADSEAVKPVDESETAASATKKENERSNSQNGEKASQKKVKLAPAPVPSTNAWGTTPKVIPVGKDPITETILKESHSQQAKHGDSNLFKAPSGKEKWLPFKASVVIASGKNAGNGGKSGSGKRTSRKKTRNDQERRSGSRKQSPKKAGGSRQAGNGVSAKSEAKTPAKTAQHAEQKPEVAAHTAEQQQQLPQAQKQQRVQRNGKQQQQQQQQPPQQQQQQQQQQQSQQQQQQHNHGPANGFQSKQYRSHGSNQGHGRRYNNVNLPYIPYNRQYYVPMMYVNMNGEGSKEGRDVSKAEKPEGKDGAKSESAETKSEEKSEGRRHRRRMNYGQPYMMQPMFAPMGYAPYGQRYGSMMPVAGQFASGANNAKVSKESQLESLAKQIDYYFSTQNLIKDIFLRKNMNDDGFLPLKVVAGFYRVSMMSFNNLNTVIECLSRCKDLEYGVVKNSSGEKSYKLRPIKNPKQWILAEDQRVAAGKDNTNPEIAAGEPENAAQDN